LAISLTVLYTVQIVSVYCPYPKTVEHFNDQTTDHLHSLALTDLRCHCHFYLRRKKKIMTLRWGIPVMLNHNY